MLELPSVTLVCIDCEQPGLALAALEQSMLRARFGDVVLFTDRDLAIAELRVVRIAPLRGAEARLGFIAGELASHLRTSHVLFIAWDAFVVNPAAWDDSFLAYDFVAPISTGPGTGDRSDGIALASSRLLRALGRSRVDGPARLVDAAIDAARPSAAGDPQLAIAPRALREKFAFDTAPPNGQPFGFQGVYNLWMFLRAADIDALLAMATPAILGSHALVSLAANLRDLGRTDEARAVLAAILRAHPGHPLAQSLAGARAPAPQLATAAATTAPVGRNDPCPCGSGRKYKQCHGSLAAPQAPATIPPPPTDATEAFLPLGSIAVLRSRAQAALERSDIAGAEPLYRRILDRRPDDPVANAYLGTIATKARRYDEAEALLERALALDPQAADFHNNLGMLRHAQARFAEAIAAYRRALELAPGHGAFHNNLGLSLQESGALDDAIASFREAVRAMPAFADAHWNLGLALLLRGDYDEGLREHEWRMQSAQHQSWWAPRRAFPEWRGEPLDGRRILVLAEQGMGDMVQFVRFAALLADRGATVVVEAAPELAELLATAPGVAEVARLGGPYPRCDVQVPMLSLPLRFGTRVDSIPAPDRYLRADRERIARWANLLGPRIRPQIRPRIGIAWAGNPNHVRDRFRSMPLPAFLPLFALDDYEWLGLQKGAAAGEIALLPPELRVRDLGRDLETFADLAALIEALDFVITVDTAVVHVAGALGKPALLLVDAANDWRWPRAGSDSRWYPSVRIARQPAPGDWAGAIRAAVRELRWMLPAADVAAMEARGR